MRTWAYPVDLHSKISTCCYSPVAPSLWQWLKRKKMSTISSFMFAVSVFEGHVLGRIDSPIPFDRKTTWAVPRQVFFQKHEGTNLSDKVMYSRAAVGKPHFCSLTFHECQRKKNARCVPAPTWKLSFGSCVVYWLTYSTKTDAANMKLDMVDIFSHFSHCQI